MNTTTGTYADLIEQELIDIRKYLLRRHAAGHVSKDLLALRDRIDARAEALEDTEDMEDGLISLIAAVIEYRVALWDEPINYQLYAGAAPLEGTYQ